VVFAYFMALSDVITVIQIRVVRVSMFSRIFTRAAQALIWPSTVFILALSWESAALADDAAIQEIRRLYLESSQPGGGNSSVLNWFSRLFTEIDRDGDGVNLQEVDLAEKVRTAQGRAQIAAEKLRYDLDGDLVVTRQELESVLGYETGRGRRFSNAEVTASFKREMMKRADKIMKADADGNGQLSGTEVSKPDPERNRDYGGFSQQIVLARAMLKADPNGDGVLTEAETFAILAKVFEGTDSVTPSP
jgi:hypothetical protein